MSAVAYNVNFDKEKEAIETFLLTYQVTTELPPNHDAGQFIGDIIQSVKYMDILTKVADREEDSINIHLDDVAAHDENLARRIAQNTKRYIDLFSQVIDKIMPESMRPLGTDDSIIDVIINQRQRMEGQTTDEATGQTVTFPPTLKRRYTVFFIPPAKQPAMAVRDIRAQHIGHLVQLRGIITRVSDVKPLLTVSTYSCDICGFEVFQEVKSRTVTPLTQCASPFCAQNRSRGKLHLQVRASKFLRFQEAKIQELANQVPMGHIPRTMTVHLYEGMTRSVNTGDIVTLSGVFLPTPYTGYKAIRAGLLADTYLDAQWVHQTKKSYQVMCQEEQSVADIMNRIMTKTAGENVYEVLAKSICPEIYGMIDVKKALLLLLLGGATKQVSDGMRIRGDINVLLMGDPGVAKSQLLKWTAKVAPRGVYTTGKGSTGVGLTAAVMKDPVTNEMVLEGGALVLADNGVCCIDEFDKMEDGDKTAIHEVMEQQTISISKAGIVTTLNARASILAAANPVYGRYNTSLSPNQNINLPAALLSRFDIVFLLLDVPDMDNDTRLAQHVTRVHMNSKAPEKDGHALLTEEEMRTFISQAMQFRPTVPAAVGEYITNVYVGVRKAESQQNSDHGYTTARTLVSILRMSQALARLRFSEQVSIPDVDEALRLMSESKRSLESKRKNRNRGQSPISVIFNILKSMRDELVAQHYADHLHEHDEEEEQRGMDQDIPNEVSLTDLRERVIAKGMTETQLENMLEEYTDLGVLMVTTDRSRIRFLIEV